MNFNRHKLSSWLPQLNPQVWILAIGRFLSEVGTGFTLFYAPIFFVNQVGFSSTSVGLALGSASISGILGRILGGSFADSRFWGRRRTLLLSSGIAAIASLVLAATNNFPTLVIGNLLAGLGQGLYWPPNEALVADLTVPEQRQEAYAVTRLADNFGMGMGIVAGGALVGTTGAYRALFLIDGISFVVFFVVVYFAIKESYRPTADKSKSDLYNAWVTALRDRRFLVYLLVNIIFTTYTSQLHSTLPLYLKNFVPVGDSKGFSETIISALFGWHLVVAILCQLPVARALRQFNHSQALSISAIVWGLGFSVIWATSFASSNQLGWAILALGLLALGTVSYTPSASSLVTDLAPPAQIGIYFSISSLCWAIGYFIGPPLGGWALDQSPQVASNLWLGLAGSIVVTIAILQYLDKMLRKNAEL